MATETERKFLVSGEFMHLASYSEEFVQMYMVKDSSRTIRIRLAGKKAYLTVKGRPEAGHIARDEWEFRIPSAAAREMLPLCLPGKIEKTRYYIPAGKHTWEVDVFHGRHDGLIIAEIELGSEDEPFERPLWLGREVTGDPAYYNSNLASSEATS